MVRVEQSMSMQQHFTQFVGKQKKLDEHYLGISEAEQLKFDWLMNFRYIEFHLVRF